MGAWGTGIYQNDRASDLEWDLKELDSIDRDVYFNTLVDMLRECQKEGVADMAEELRVLADCFVKLVKNNYVIDKDFFGEIEDAYLNGVLKNDVWKDEWNDPKEIAELVDHEYNLLVEILKTNWANVDRKNHALKNKDLPDHINF